MYDNICMHAFLSWLGVCLLRAQISSTATTSTTYLCFYFFHYIHFPSRFGRGLAKNFPTLGNLCPLWHILYIAPRGGTINHVAVTSTLVSATVWRLLLWSHDSVQIQYKPHVHTRLRTILAMRWYDRTYAGMYVHRNKSFLRKRAAARYRVVEIIQSNFIIVSLFTTTLLYIIDRPVSVHRRRCRCCTRIVITHHPSKSKTFIHQHGDKCTNYL